MLAKDTLTWDRFAKRVILLRCYGMAQFPLFYFLSQVLHSHTGEWHRILWVISLVILCVVMSFGIRCTLLSKTGFLLLGIGTISGDLHVA